MSESNHSKKNATQVLKETSRTFFIPISYLPSELRDTVTSAYLCMRAIDEVEDHHELDATIKSQLLYTISEYLDKKTIDDRTFEELFKPYQAELPEVTLRLAEWIELCPTAIQANVLSSTSTMAKGMADWVNKDWQIKDKADLDDYTYYVAGLVGVMLSDIWEWYDNTETDQDLAIAFGRGLQSVNILRNHEEDQGRGVSFFPEGWELEDMFQYARQNLALADDYIKDISTDSILHFCKIPLALAHATLEALTAGKEKMSRTDVTEVVSRIVGK